MRLSRPAVRTAPGVVRRAAAVSQLRALGGAGCQRRRPSKTANPGPIRWDLLVRRQQKRPGRRVSAASGWCLWGPRSLDLDLLWGGGHGHSRQIRGRPLQLELRPPRLRQRTFVLIGAAGGDRARVCHPGNHNGRRFAAGQAAGGLQGDTNRSSCLVATGWPEWGSIASGVNRAGYGRRVMLESPQPCSMAPLPPPSRPPTWKPRRALQARKDPFELNRWCCDGGGAPTGSFRHPGRPPGGGPCSRRAGGDPAPGTASRRVGNAHLEFPAPPWKRRRPIWFDAARAGRRAGLQRPPAGLARSDCCPAPAYSDELIQPGSWPRAQRLQRAARPPTRTRT